MGQGDDFPSILCALDSNCAMFQVSSPVPVFLVAPVIGGIATTFAGTAGLQGSSPVDIDVIAPDNSRMGTTFSGIAGASYMNIIGNDGHETTTVLVPFPQGGSYAVKAIPREGSLPTDSFTITLTQNGVTTTIADHAMIQDIPVDGFHPHVNSRPFANAGADQTVECGGPSGTPATLNGSLSSDQDGDVLTYVWTDSQGNIVGNTAVVTVVAAMGTQSYSLTVTDPSGLSAKATTQVTVRDTTPPVVHLTLTPSSLWPPDHKLVPITANIQVSDVCDPNPTVTLVSIKSNEPDSGTGDIQGATFGSDDRSFLLRAERLGTGTGRTYTVSYRVTDLSGNTTIVSGQVRVPHDQGVAPF
ncbi:MAG: PKD domain-containing protein [Candidatus Angelobacter sp.]